MQSRDGVGDGQIPYVIKLEIAAIVDCFKKTGMEGMKLTYIIASKSINTRLFRIHGGEAHKSSKWNSC